jgi:hypothetical protein
MKKKSAKRKPGRPRKEKGFSERTRYRREREAWAEFMLGRLNGDAAKVKHGSRPDGKRRADYQGRPDGAA